MCLLQVYEIKEMFTPDHEIFEMLLKNYETKEWVYCRFISLKKCLLQIMRFKERFAPDFEIKEMFTPDLKYSKNRLTLGL